MKKSIILLAFISIFSCFLFTSCIVTLPISSSVNDFVNMGTKINSKDAVSLNYSSKVQDGLIKPYRRDKLKLRSNHQGFKQNINSVFGRMLGEYMTNKFSKYNANTSTSTPINISLEDFWIEQYAVDSPGGQVATVLFGGGINHMCVATVKVHISFFHDGQDYAKRFEASAEDIFIEDMETDNYNQGKDSIQNIHGRNVQRACNKVLMFMNNYFEEIGM